MKTVLCYGDSNTWGYSPIDGTRYARDVRWPGVLRNELGEGYLVIEEGLNGRTTVWDDPIEGYKNGNQYLTQIAPPRRRPARRLSRCAHPHRRVLLHTSP